MNDIGLLVLYVFGAVVVIVIVLFFLVRVRFFEWIVLHIRRRMNKQQPWYPASVVKTELRANDMINGTAFRQPRNVAIIDTQPSQPVLIEHHQDQPVFVESERSLLEDEKLRLLQLRAALVEQFKQADEAFAQLLQVVVTNVVKPQRKDFLIDEICIVNDHLVCEVIGIVQGYFEVLCLSDGITEYSATIDMLSVLPRSVQAAIRKSRRDKADISRRLEDSGFELIRVNGRIQEIDRSSSVTPRTPRELPLTPPAKKLVTPPKLRQPIFPNTIPGNTETVHVNEHKKEKTHSIIDVAKEMHLLRNNGSTIDERRRYFKSLLLKYHPDKTVPGETPDWHIFEFIQEKRTWFLT